MHVSVIGAGYVGLVTAACLARLGNRVHVLEADADRVAGLQRGEVPVREPGLDELIAEGGTAGRLTFSHDPAGIRGTRLAIVCVGTLDPAGEWTDRTVRRVVMDVAADSAAPRQIVIRSTLMPGVAAELQSMCRQVDPTVAIAFNPEFTREANAVNDFLMPDRIVIGATPPEADSPLVNDLRSLLSPLEAPLLVTDLTSAELIKIASNVFLAAKITFANELARLSASIGADVETVVQGMGLDQRIGRGFLSPGPGYGGSCFPSQARALPILAQRLGVRARLIGAIAQSNEEQPNWLLDTVEASLDGGLDGRRVAVLGLTFKAGTDDLRESPSLQVVEALSRRGASVAAFDPVATRTGVADLAKRGVVVDAADSARAACAGADVVIVTTEWPEFRYLEWRDIAEVMNGRLVIDGRRVVDVGEAHAAGLEVSVLGAVARPLARAI